VGRDHFHQESRPLARGGGGGVSSPGGGAGAGGRIDYNSNLLVQDRNGLIVNAELRKANGRAERDAALLMLEQVPAMGVSLSAAIRPQPLPSSRFI
jgi:hypothetical protein